MAELPTLCPFALLTGTACPGCGMTRAVVHMLRGEWLSAWSYHPLAFLVVLAAIGTAIWLLGVRTWNWRPISRQLLDQSLLGAAAAFLVVWAIRIWASALPPVTGVG